MRSALWRTGTEKSLNRLWEELDFGYGDLYNEGHVNESGADKVTACLLEYLREHYDGGSDWGRSGEPGDFFIKFLV